MSGTVVLTEKWPVLGRHGQAGVWLQIWADLGRAPRTIDAYARGLAEYLLMCEREDVDPIAANRAHVAVFVRELTSRPHRRGGNVVSIESGSGLANATIQQRLVPVRLFYDFLMEEGVRESNPVGRGRYTPGSGAGTATRLGVGPLRHPRPHDPAVQPADVGNALRLRAAWTLEHAIDDLIERHLRVAADALTLFISLSRQVSSDRARDSAIRRAGITFGLSGSPGQDSTALLQGTVLSPGQCLLSGPRPPARLGVVPGQPPVREFPAAADSGGVPPGPARPSMSGPGGPYLPARRPRRPHR